MESVFAKTGVFAKWLVTAFLHRQKDRLGGKAILDIFDRNERDFIKIFFDEAGVICINAFDNGWEGVGEAEFGGVRVPEEGEFLSVFVQSADGVGGEGVVGAQCVIRREGIRKQGEFYGLPSTVHGLNRGDEPLAARRVEVNEAAGEGVIEGGGMFWLWNWRLGGGGSGSVQWPVFRGRWDGGLRAAVRGLGNTRGKSQEQEQDDERTIHVGLRGKMLA